MAYWFVEVLFIISLCYIACVLFAKLCKQDVSLWLMTILSGLLMAHKVPQNCVARTLNMANVCLCMQFFVAGLWAKKYMCQLLNKLSGSHSKALLITSFIILLCLRQNEWIVSHNIIYRIISNIAIQYVGILLMTSMFYAGTAYINSAKFSAKAICLIGRRTLDIYMLHYFFLPTLPMLKDFIEPNNMVLFQIIVAGGIALMIIAMCLLVSSVLRSSPFLADWLFGVRQQQN